MAEMNHLAYHDRYSGELTTEPILASGFLSWSYNTRLGWLATDLLFRRRSVSRLYGWLHKRRWSCRRLRRFVDQMNVNVDEALRPLDEYTSFNDFFTREIDLSTRPVQGEPHVCVSPVDGRALAYPSVDADTTFRIKRSVFNLRRFLHDDALAEHYAGGSMLISRLYLSDYHHYHFPDSGVPGVATSIPGRYYAVSPYALRRLVPFYTENHRMLTLFDSDHFGQIAIMEIGAFTVGSIQQRYRPGVRVDKSAHKGFFELGGSTVVMLFEKGAIELDADLCTYTAKGIETYVRLGDSIGRAPAGSRGQANTGGGRQ